MAEQGIPEDMAAAAKFSAFSLVHVDYKTVNNTPIPATVLVPKDIQPGRYPVLVRFHGGCLTMGHRMFPDWFQEWILELAISKKAIVISPDYRLLPEANGLDILEDLQDLFTWLTTPSNLARVLPDGVSPDLDHILVTGDSAGGWLALQSALLPGPRKHVSAVISHYPMIDMRNEHYTKDYEKYFFNPPMAQLDRSILRDYLSNMKQSNVITSSVPPDRGDLAMSFLQQGVFGSHFGDDRLLYPLEALETIGDLPPIWVLHGTRDTIIPVEGTYKYEKALKEKLPDAKAFFHYDQDSDHGFDLAPHITLNTDWVRQGVDFISQYWPRC